MALTQQQYQMTPQELSGGQTGIAAYNTRIANLRAGDTAVAPTPAPTPTPTASATPMATGAPAASPTFSATSSNPNYTVVGGDSLSKIASAHNLSLDQIKQYNPQFAANWNLIHPGQQVNLGPGTALGIPNSIASGGSATPTPTTPIDATSLKSGSQQLQDILGANAPVSSGNSELDRLLALQGADTAQQKTVSDFQTKLTDMMGSLGNEGNDLQAELDKQGVGAAYQQVKELNLKAASLKGALEKFDAETLQQKAGIADQAIPTGLITGQQAQYQQQRDLTKLGMTAELSGVLALSQAYQGNATLGMELATKSIDLKYQPILAKIDVLKTQLGFANADLSREDAKRSGVIAELIKVREAEINKQKTLETQVATLKQQAAAAGAPYAIVTSVPTDDPVKAASLLNQWLKAPIESTVKAGGTGGGTSGTGTGTKVFTQTQINKGAANAGLPLADFSKLSNDSKNYYINSYSVFQNYLKNIVAGTEDAQTVSQNISSSNLPQDVKDNLLGKLKPYLTSAPASGGDSGFHWWNPLTWFSGK